ncbi:hypothetical protein COOONC_20825 [Cooperia oncophora]
MNNSRFLYILADNDLNIRLVSEELDDGSFMPSSKAKSSLLTSDKAGWEQYVQVKPDDTSITQPVDFDKSNRNVYCCGVTSRAILDMICSQEPLFDNLQESIRAHYLRQLGQVG